MYVVSLMFSSGQRQVNLTFDSQDKAVSVFYAYVEDRYVTIDDYGSWVATFNDKGPLDAVMFQDIAAAQRAGIELALMHTKAQVTAQNRANADPTLRSIGMLQGGPSVPGLQGFLR